MQSTTSRSEMTTASLDVIVFDSDILGRRVGTLTDVHHQKAKRYPLVAVLRVGLVRFPATTLTMTVREPWRRPNAPWRVRKSTRVEDECLLACLNTAIGYGARRISCRIRGPK